MVMVRVTVAAIIIVIMASYSSVTLVVAGGTPSMAVSLSVVIGRCD